MKLREEVQELLNKDAWYGVIMDAVTVDHGAEVATKFYEPLLTEKDTRIRELEAELKRRTEMLKGLHISSTKYLFIAKLDKDLSDEEAEQLFKEYCEQNNIPLDE